MSESLELNIGEIYKPRFKVILITLIIKLFVIWRLLFDRSDPSYQRDYPKILTFNRVLKLMNMLLSDPEVTPEMQIIIYMITASAIQPVKDSIQTELSLTCS